MSNACRHVGRWALVVANGVNAGWFVIDGINGTSAAWGWAAFFALVTAISVVFVLGPSSLTRTSYGWSLRINGVRVAHGEAPTQERADLDMEAARQEYQL